MNVATFEPLLEALVIRYHFDATSSTFVLVCEHREKLPGSSRAFVRFEFDGARNFQRAYGVHVPFRRFSTDYSVADDVASIVVQNVDCNMARSPRRIFISLGSSFGSVCFDFDIVRADVRDMRVVKVGAEWHYFDWQSGERVSFDDPFGDWAN